jgi:magnesium-transporting ATPase (P-type)
VKENAYEEAYFPIPVSKRPARRRRSKLFSKIVVVSLLLSIVAYVITVFYFIWYGKYVPDSLTYTFLPAIIGQLGLVHNITRKDKDVEIAEIQAQAQTSVTHSDTQTYG